MINHYGNWIVDGIIGVGEEVSGGYTFPTTIGASADVLVVTLDILGGKHLQFKDLRDAPYNFATKDDIVTTLSGAPQYLTQLLDITGDYAGNKDRVLTVNTTETMVEFSDPRANFEHIHQTSHGFSVGQPLYRSNSGLYELAISDVDFPEKAEVVGIVEEILSIDDFRIVYSGKVKNLSGLVDGSVYFLDKILGTLTTTRYGGNSIVKPVLVATSTTDAIFVNYVGFSGILDFINENAFHIITSDTALDVNYSYVVVDSGVTTITLPNATAYDKKSYKLSNLSGVSVVISGTETIDNNSSYTFLNGSKIEVRAENDAWWIF